MSGIATAVLTTALLSCGLLTASAAESSDDPGNKGQWLQDGACSLFSAGAHPGDTASWTGSCADGYAEGLGTATFTHNGQTQSATATLVHGVIPDGHVIRRWGQGWIYDGETVGGRFQGVGILTTDACDRFDGQWIDGKLNGFGVLLRADGELYAGEWKDGKPNGIGELRRADGMLTNGLFVDGKLAQAGAAASTGPADPVVLPFASVSDASSVTSRLIQDGNGEVMTHLNQFEPPAGGCERTRTAFAN